MSDYVGAVLAMEVDALEPTALQLYPHDAPLLVVRLTPREQGMESADGRGRSVRFSSLRVHRGVSNPAGDCLSVFALLTPLGAVKLLGGQNLAGEPVMRADAADLLGWKSTALLEDQLLDMRSVQAKCEGLLRWIESRVMDQGWASPFANRTALVAQQLAASTNLSIEEAARSQRLTRRQLERDFVQWLAVTPKQYTQTVRLQRAIRLARSGVSLAQAALEAGFSDQAHMSHVVKRMTGLTPKRLLQPAGHVMTKAFRLASGGGLAYG